MSRFAKVCCLLISTGLLIYTILRAFKLSFVHDESYTYLYSAHNSFMEIISNRTVLTSPNNHILNTLLMKLFELLFGSSEIALRLQSILAHILYLTITYLLLKPLKSDITIVFGFILLNVNPYLLEFFSLARGYALALSFILLSIYYFIQYTETEKQKPIIYCLITASLAILSNFALLNYFAALLIIHQIFIYSKYHSLKINFQKSKPVLITIMIMAAILYEPIRKIHNNLDFGGVTGIWDDTVASLIITFLVDKKLDFIFFRIIQTIVLATIIGYAFVIGRKIYKRETLNTSKNGSIIFFVLILIIGLTMLEHYILGSPYLLERFALFLVPLFVFVLVFLLNQILQTGKTGKIISTILFITLTIGSFLNFSKCANLHYTTNWDYDADTKDMITDLINEKELSGKQDIKLGISWLFEPTVNFYRITKKLDWLKKVNRKGFRQDCDYYYILPEDHIKMNSLQKTTIKYYPISQSKLLK